MSSSCETYALNLPVSCPEAVFESQKLRFVIISAGEYFAISSSSLPSVFPQVILVVAKITRGYVYCRKSVHMLFGEYRYQVVVLLLIQHRSVQTVPSHHLNDSRLRYPLPARGPPSARRWLPCTLSGSVSRYSRPRVVGHSAHGRPLFKTAVPACQCYLKFLSTRRPHRRKTSHRSRPA